MRTLTENKTITYSVSKGLVTTLRSTKLLSINAILHLLLSLLRIWFVSFEIFNVEIINMNHILYL